MVSFQESNIISSIENSTGNNNNKRKWEGGSVGGGVYNLLSKFSNVETTKSFFDIDFHLEKPLTTLDWKQCIDVQSGDIHFYNTKPKKKTTCKDNPKLQSSERLMSLGAISLDLELNLPCNSSVLKTKISSSSSSSNHHHHDAVVDDNYNWMTKPTTDQSNSFLSMNITSSTKKKKSDDDDDDDVLTSWTTFEQADKKEMVAAVCFKCNMLVMMCKFSPACPNCKFIYPPHQNPISLFKPISYV